MSHPGEDGALILVSAIFTKTKQITINIGCISNQVPPLTLRRSTRSTANTPIDAKFVNKDQVSKSAPQGSQSRWWFSRNYQDQWLWTHGTARSITVDTATLCKNDITISLYFLSQFFWSYFTLCNIHLSCFHLPSTAIEIRMFNSLWSSNSCMSWRNCLKLFLRIRVRFMSVAAPHYRDETSPLNCQL